jgi:hypothetical protein
LFALAFRSPSARSAEGCSCRGENDEVVFLKEESFL